MNKKEISILFNKIINYLGITARMELKVINNKRYEDCGTFCTRGNTSIIHINKYHNKNIEDLQKYIRKNGFSKS
jgi:hypothetical protein